MKTKKLWSYANTGLIFLSFLIVLLVDMFVSLSSGDDQIYLELAKNCGLVEFIRRCGTARLSKKISLYFVMSSNLMVWRVINAVVFTTFYLALCKIIQILIGGGQTR